MLKYIYGEKKMATVQSSLDKFLRRMERAASSTSSQASTSSAASAFLIADVDADDVDPDDVVPIS
jgi:hypothetical protein